MIEFHPIRASKTAYRAKTRVQTQTHTTSRSTSSRTQRQPRLHDVDQPSEHTDVAPASVSLVSSVHHSPNPQALSSRRRTTRKIRVAPAVHPAPTITSQRQEAWVSELPQPTSKSGSVAINATGTKPRQAVPTDPKHFVVKPSEFLSAQANPTHVPMSANHASSRGVGRRPGAEITNTAPSNHFSTSESSHPTQAGNSHIVSRPLLVPHVDRCVSEGIHAESKTAIDGWVGVEINASDDNVITSRPIRVYGEARAVANAQDNATWW